MDSTFIEYINGSRVGQENLKSYRPVPNLEKIFRNQYNHHNKFTSYTQCLMRDMKLRASKLILYF